MLMTGWMPQIPPKKESCFYEAVEANKQLQFQFEVMRGGLLDIQLRIKAPDGNSMYDKLAFFNRQVLKEQTCLIHGSIILALKISTFCCCIIG